jgi:hypothetical protein
VRGVRRGVLQDVEPLRVEVPDLTLAGSRRKASIVAYSIGSYRAQMPVGDRKSGIPLSVETPAPVSTTHGCDSTINAARRSADIPELYATGPGARAGP